jgi:hypothetical protein
MALRGASDGPTYLRNSLAAGSGIIRTSSDVANYHAYAANNTPSPFTAVAYLRNMRKVLTDLGSPTKPILMSEVSAGTGSGTFWLNLDPATRRSFMARATITGLLADPYTVGFMWYGLDQGNYGWNQADVDFWNDMVTYMTSGPVTKCVVNQDGTVSVTIGATSRIY